MPISRAGSLLCVCGGGAEAARSPKATTEAVTPSDTDGHQDRATTDTSQCPSGGADGKSTPSLQPAQHPGGPGSTLRGLERPNAAEPRKGGRLTLPPFLSCDYNPRSQVKSPSSKNSHPSSLPTQQPGRAQGRGRPRYTAQRGSSWDEADRRDHLWKASPGCSPLHCASRGPVLHQQASPCPPTSCARTRGTLVPGLLESPPGGTLSWGLR